MTTARKQRRCPSSGEGEGEPLLHGDVEARGDVLVCVKRKAKAKNASPSASSTSTWNLKLRRHHGHGGQVSRCRRRVLALLCIAAASYIAGLVLLNSRWMQSKQKRWYDSMAAMDAGAGGVALATDGEVRLPPFYVYDDHALGVPWSEMQCSNGGDAIKCLASPSPSPECDDAALWRSRLRYSADYWFRKHALDHPQRVANPEDAQLFVVPALLNSFFGQTGILKTKDDVKDTCCVNRTGVGDDYGNGNGNSQVNFESFQVVDERSDGLVQPA